MMAFMRMLSLSFLVAIGCSQLASAAFFTCFDIVDSMQDCIELVETQNFFEHEGLKIGYWVYEDLAARDESMDPVILVHGGPGVPSEYMVSLKQLACRGRKVIRYDQGGVGASYVSNVTANAPFLFDLDYYPGELCALIDHLGLDRYHVLGHSWGTCVAQMFAITEPANMSSLLLIGALSSGEFYIESQKKVRQSTLPPYIRKLMAQIEIDQAYNSALYAAINDHLTGLWTINTIPMPDCVERALGATNEEIYVAINGPSEFSLAPKLWTWNVTGLVDGNRYPTIVVGGANDTMTIETLEQVSNGIENSELFIIPKAAHMCFVDQPDMVLDLIQKFMIEHDQGETHETV